MIIICIQLCQSIFSCFLSSHGDRSSRIRWGLWSVRLQKLAGDFFPPQVIQKCNWMCHYYASSVGCAETQLSDTTVVGVTGNHTPSFPTSCRVTLKLSVFFPNEWHDATTCICPIHVFASPTRLERSQTAHWQKKARQHIENSAFIVVELSYFAAHLITQRSTKRTQLWVLLHTTKQCHLHSERA